MASVTTNSNMGPRETRSANTPIYWGVGILAAIIVALALFMRPEKISSSSSATDHTLTAQTLDTTPKTNTSTSQQVDPATGAAIKGMATDPRTERLHNGANSPNGGIAPNPQPLENQNYGK
ncbi:MAG: hypothetical protein H7Z71_11735 [Moraxellaceae bacterium]|nr:hypothetical protein [Pseudobdellovibrionaceae bacterium]